MDEIFNENLEEYEDLIPKDVVIIEVPQRENPFCIISKATRGKNAIHDIQTNSCWSANPYREDYAVVPDELVPGIVATNGYCDIILSDDGTEVVDFSARDIPEVPTVKPEKTLEERIAVLEETVASGGGASGESIWDEMAVAIEEGVNEV